MTSSSMHVVTGVRRRSLLTVFSVLLVFVLQLSQHHIASFRPAHAFKSTFFTSHYLQRYDSTKPLVAQHKYDLMEGSKPRQAVSLPSIDALSNQAKVNQKLIVSNTIRNLRNVSFLFVGLLAGLRYKFKQMLPSSKDSQAVSDGEMETGWTKRGFNGSFARTVEVWTFAISFLLKYVSASYFTPVCMIYMVL